MHSSQTLHDFVLNLLTNPDARSAFDLDPEGALRAAGLTDITAADVLDVVPLVVDYAPVQGITSLASLGDQLESVPAVADPGDVIGQLQQVTQHLAVPTTTTNIDVNAGVLGAISVDPSGLGAAASLPLGLAVGASPTVVGADLSVAYDVAHTLDADLVDGSVVGNLVGPEVTDPMILPTDGGADAVLGGALDPATGVLSGTLGAADGLVGSVTGGALGAVGGLGEHLGAVGGITNGLTGGGAAPDVAGAVGGVTDTVDGLTGAVGGVTGTVGGVTDTVGGVTDTVGGVLKGLTGTNLTGSVSGGVSSSVSGGGGGDAEVHGGAHASTGGGLLDLTDGLL
jgi:hypothetical protein